MPQKNNKPVVVHIDVRKLKGYPDTNLPSFSKVKLEKLIEEAVVDAYGEEEQVGGFLTMMEEHLALPFSANILGVDVVVERVDMTREWPDCRDLPPRQNPAENRNPRSAVADASACRCGMDRSVSPLAQRILSERIPVLRFSGDRPRADKSRNGRTAVHLHARCDYLNQFHESLRVGRPEGRSSQTAGEYFDVFLYVANCGTRELYLRLPQELVDYKVFRTMLPGEAAQVRKPGNSVIVAFENQFEDDDWDDGTGWMGSLMSLRSELLHGDIRCLYLGWLLCAQNEEFAEDELEPAVPAGLGELSAPLHSLIEFLGIDLGSR